MKFWCPDSNIKEEPQEPSKIGSKSTKLRYKPIFTERNSSYVKKIIELISDPYLKRPLEAKDRWCRLAGELMNVP